MANPITASEAHLKRQQYAREQEARLKDIERNWVPVDDCPLITPMTRFLNLDDEVMRLLYKIRKGGDFELPEMPRLRKIMDEGLPTEAPLELRGYQKQMLTHMFYMPRFINGDSVGLGKAQPLTAKVLTPNGWISMGDVQVGDVLVDPDGGTCRVEGIYPQGIKDTYRVTFSDGSVTECCLDHLWTVQTVAHRRNGGSYTRSLRELLDAGLNGSSPASRGWRRSKYFLPCMPAVELSSMGDLPLHPYVLGAFLGDGCLRHTVSFSSPDLHIVQKIQELWPEVSLTPTGHGCDWRVAGPRPGYVLDQFRSLGLYGCYSHEKGIPRSYLHASIPERIHLLQGLMDTDGDCSKAGLAYYTTTSSVLVGQVAGLIRSLGGVARVSPARVKTFTHRGVKKQGRPSWMLTVKTSFNPFTLAKKAERWKPQMLARAFVSAERIGAAEMQCIRVSSPRHLYYTDDWIPTHNTLDTIAAACAYDHAIGGGVKLIIFTTTTTAYQWATEIERFSTLKPWILKDAYRFKGDKKTTFGHEARVAQLKKFLEHPKLDVLICRYSQWVGRRQTLEQGTLDADGRVARDGKEHISQEIRDFRDSLQGYRSKLILAMDETQKIKTPDAQIRKLIVTIQRKFSRVWGLTATAIMNHLEEFYSITSALGISPLGSLDHFREHYCTWQPVKKGPFTDYVIEGYKHLDKFKVGMRPWYWGRSQAQVKEKLPKLQTIYHPVELSKEQTKLLLEDIPSGAYVLPPVLRKISGEWEWCERDPSNLMTMLSVYQLVANSQALLDRDNEKAYLSPKLSTKEEVLLDLLDGELLGEKVIVFTKFKGWIDRLEHLTLKGKFTDRKFLRITGDETGKRRETNRLLFQNNPGYNLIMINTAAVEGVNLQQAAHMICLDLPWSWGALIQLVGRMVRMASPHSACMLHILCALGTLDEYIIEILRSKKGVFERILGNAGTAGILDITSGDLAHELDLAATGLEDESSDDDFRDMLRAHAKKIRLGAYVKGTMLAKEAAGMRKDYNPAIQKGHEATEEELSLRW